MAINSKRAKLLQQNPKSVTSDEMKYLLSLRHEVTNLRVQVDSLLRTNAQHQALYHKSNEEAAIKGKKLETVQTDTTTLKNQISLLGNVLDNERKLIPVQRRKALKPLDKPGKPQRAGHGAYTADAPTAEDL